MPKLYNLVVNNIKKLANIGINLTVTITVMKNNIGDISKIQEFADFLDLDFEKAPIFQIGAAKLNYNLLFPDDYQFILNFCENYDMNISNPLNTNKHFTEIPKKIKKYVDCGTKSVAILSTGIVVPCLLLRDIQFKMGTISESNINYILSENNLMFNEIQEKMSYNRIYTCKSCEVKYVCKDGGCKAVSYLFDNQLDKKNPDYLNCYY